MLLTSQQQDRVLRLTLNRPEKRNALNLALCRELVTAFEAADADPSVGSHPSRRQWQSLLRLLGPQEVLEVELT